MGSEGNDIISKITKDHDELRSFYKQFKSSPDEASGNKWFNQFVWELSRHSVAEELILYPMLDKLGPRGRELSKKSREDHDTVKVLLSQAMSQKNDTAKFDEIIEKLWSDLDEHIALEEREDLAYLKDNVTDPKQLEWLGTKFDAMKKIVPTEPHTIIPSKPAALEAVLGMFAAPMDKFKDLFKEFPTKEELAREEQRSA